MALHTPVHQVGATPHPHVFRDALIGIVAAIVIVALLAMLLAVRPFTTSTSTTSIDQLTTPQAIQFRAEERAFAYPWQYTGPH